MASEKGLTDADLDSIDLAHIIQIPKKAKTVDATNVIRVDIEYGSFSSSLEDPIKEFLIQAPVTEEERVGVHDQNINNECDLNSEAVTDDAREKLLVATGSDARSENRVLQKLLRAPRYFDFPLCNWPGRNEVSEGDDLSKKGRAKKWQKLCYICGEVNHSGNRCKKVYCSICSGKGHLLKDCPNKNAEPDCASTPCLKCGNTDHNMFSCTTAYDSEDLKAIECYVCKKAGHLCCVENKGEGPIAASCYLCGERGHFAPECTKSNVPTFDVQLFCNKCKERGHSRKQCPKTKFCYQYAKSTKKFDGMAKVEKQRLRNARRRRHRKKKTPASNTLSNQPHQGSSTSVSHQGHNSINRTRDVQASNIASSSCSTFHV